MSIRPLEFDSAARWLEPFLAEVRSKKLVAVTGLIGAGKSTLSRFLAWYFNVSLIEADFYLIPHQGIECESSEVDRIVAQRHKIQRSVIVEGAAILPLLARIKRVPDGIVLVRNTFASRQPTADEVHKLNPAAWGFDRCPIYEVAVAHG